MSFVRIFPGGGVVSSRIGIAIGRLLTVVVCLLPCVSAARAADDRQVVHRLAVMIRRDDIQANDLALFIERKDLAVVGSGSR